MDDGLKKKTETCSIEFKFFKLIIKKTIVIDNKYSKETNEYN